jgi:hypothetical protein
VAKHLFDLEAAPWGIAQLPDKKRKLGESIGRLPMQLPFNCDYRTCASPVWLKNCKKSRLSAIPSSRLHAAAQLNPSQLLLPLSQMLFSWEGSNQDY